MNLKTYLTFIWLIILLFPIAFATNYYVHPHLGNNENSGTSMVFPFQDLEKINTIQLESGDAILLAAGQTFIGSLIFKNVNGTAENPITVSSYYGGNALEDKRAIIDAKGNLNAIYIENSSHIQIKDIILTANGGGIKGLEKKKGMMRCGVLVTTSQSGEYQNISLENLLVKDIFFEESGFERGKKEVRTANGSQNYGWGIRFINRTKDAFLKDLTVSNCIIQNVAHTGIKFTGRSRSIQNIKIYDNRVLKTGGPGIQISGVVRGNVKGNYVDQSGSKDDSRKWGRGSGLWTWGCSDIIIEHNTFTNANGPADSAGCHIDFNCKNVIVQYNFSANNAGGFCEILGNNYNCAYRYNVSVNDGHRMKKKNGAFQEGKTFWLSGFVGKDRERHGPYNSYFYNNTIYVSKDIVSKIAVTKKADGVLIANNIFCVEGESKAVLGDQYTPEKGPGGHVENVIFKNNLFLHANIWPKEVLIQSQDKMLGDPQFYQKGGMDITSYIPMNQEVIKNKGIEIPYISNDSLGLILGLKVDADILGSKIKGKPDLGAIELE